MFYFYLTFQWKDEDILEIYKQNANDCFINEKKMHILLLLIDLKKDDRFIGHRTKEVR